jgi:DNA gyrase subunit A
MDLGTIQRVDIDEEVQQAYLDYAMSVIVARALPDARDGLKPVQRRILYAMHDMNIRPDGDFKKSARIVGEVLGKYHPHGDMAVYEAMARMAQEFSLRYPLVEGQGNFGSIDGDAPAAMRYTEARLAPLAVSMLADLEKETVPFGANFDGTLREPEVLPSAAPSLLVNGTTGIAVGMATSIPPHNLGEVCEALIFMLRSWTRTREISTEELLRFVKGPDFPTGGLILDRPGREEGLSAAYGSGRGKVTVRAKVRWEEAGKGRGRLLVTELPFQVNKTALLERIAQLAREGDLEGISDLRDESDRQGMRIVIELSRSADPEGVLRELYQHTPMETTFSIILLALVQGEPRLLSLKQALRVFLEHRLEIIQKRSQFDLARARERALLLQGLRVALRNLEDVIRIVRGARTAAEASERLQKRYRLVPVQAEAILDMPLRRLAALEREKIEQEHKEKVGLIATLERLLGSPKLLREALIDELQQLKSRFGDARRTTILNDGDDLRSHPLITSQIHSRQSVWITLTETGQLSRGGTSDQPLHYPQTPLKAVRRGSLKDTLCLFTSKGRLAGVPPESLPTCDTHPSGVHVSAVSQVEETDSVECLLALAPMAKSRKGYLALITRRGMIKKLSLKDLRGPSAQMASVMKIGTGDALAWAVQTTGRDELVLVTERGMSIRFREEEIRPTSPAAAGVRAVRLSPASDAVVWAGTIRPGENLLLVDGKGRAKRTPISEFPRQAKSGVGTRAWQSAEDRLVGAAAGRREDPVLFCFADGHAQVWPLAAFPLRARTAKAARPEAFGKGAKIVRLIALEKTSAGGRPSPRRSTAAKSGSRRTPRAAGARGGKASGRPATAQRGGKAKKTGSVRTRRGSGRTPGRV